MAFVILALYAATLLAGGLLCFQLVKLRCDLQALQSRIADTPGIVPATKAPVIGIEILNPFELATATNRLARPLIAIAPGLITRIVYRRTVGILESQLAQRGVSANVKIYAEEVPDAMG